MTELLKTIAYKISKMDIEERGRALIFLTRVKRTDVIRFIAAMTELYVASGEGKLSEAEAKELMQQIEKNVEEKCYEK